MIKVNPTWKWIIISALVIVLLLVFWYLRSLIIYILISGVLSIISEPLINKLNALHFGKYKFSPTLSALITLILIWSVLAGLISIVVPLAAQEMRVLYSLDYEAIASELHNMLKGFDDGLRDLGMLTGEGSSSLAKQKIQNALSIDGLTGIFGVFVSGVGNLFVAFFSISFITFFFLRETDLFRRIIMTFIPPSLEKQTIHVFATSKELLSRYFIGIFIQVSLITTLVSIGLSLAGVNNAFIIGIFAGLINIIPYIGPLFGAGVGFLIALTTGLDPNFTGSLSFLLIKVAGVFAVVQLMDNVLFQPIIFSNSVKAHPLEIFLVISIAGTLGGIPSMILAIPGYTFLRIIAKEFFSQFKVVQDLTKNI